MIKKIAYRKGIGNILAEGTKIASDKIKGSADFAIHVKGMELPGYDIRGAKAHGLGYATAFTGADHNRGYAFQEIFGVPVPYAVDRLSIEGKGKLTKWNQDVRTATCDCPTMCVFLLDMAMAPRAAESTAAFMEAVTGLVFSADEVARVGERINTWPGPSMSGKACVTSNWRPRSTRRRGRSQVFQAVNFAPKETVFERSTSCVVAPPPFMLVFAGYTPTTYRDLNDIWSLSLKNDAAWMRLDPEGAPEARSCPSASSRSSRAIQISPRP
jgi:hypothetical protein